MSCTVLVLGAGLPACTSDTSSSKLPSELSQPAHASLTVEVRPCPVVGQLAAGLEQGSPQWVAGRRTALEVTAVRTLMSSPDAAVHDGSDDPANPWGLPTDTLDQLGDEAWWASWCDDGEIDEAALTTVNTALFDHRLLAVDVDVMVGDLIEDAGA